MKYIIVYNAAFWNISGIIYMAQNNDKWFSRILLGTISMGFLYLGECIEKRRKDERDIKH